MNRVLRIAGGKTSISLLAAVTLCLMLLTPQVQAKDSAGEPVVLKFWTPNYPAENEITRILSKDLEKLGIKLDVKSSNYDVWVADIVNGDNPFHLAMCTWGSSPDRMDPNFFLTEVFHSSRAKPKGRNYGNYINKEYDKLVDAQVKEMDRKKRQELVWKAQEILDKDIPWYNVYIKVYWQAYNSDRLTNVNPVLGSGIGFPFIPVTFLDAKPTTDQKEMTVVNIHDLISLNLLQCPDVENEWWLRLIYDPLLRRDKDAKLIPWAAESWKVVDPKTMDIVLRAGMKFHDGHPVTAEDLKFTVDYGRKWKIPLLTRVWDNIVKAEIIDDRTVRFHLKEAYAPFVETILTYLAIIPKHIWEKIPESAGVKSPMDWTNPKPIGSGAYKFDVWKKGEYFHLVANKDHFNAPAIDGLYVKVIPTIEGIVAAMEKGEADIVGWNLDAEQAKRLDAFPHLTKVSAESIAWTEIRPNLKMKPMDDHAFRRAVNHALNRKLMLDITYGGHGIVGMNTPISPSIKFWNNPKIKTPEFALEKARKILKDAGYTWNKKGQLCYPKN